MPLGEHAAKKRRRVVGDVPLDDEERRGGALASIPTWKEVGIDAIVDNWRGIVGPTGMPAREVAYWDQAFERLFKQEEWKTNVERNHWDNAALTSRESAKYLNQTYAELKRTLGELGMVK